MSILMVLSYLLCFIAGLALGRYVNFLDKKGKENKEAIVKANKPEDSNTIEENDPQEEQQEDLKDYPPVSVWIKRKNIADWDENFPLNVRWKYECQNCGYESQELLPECPHCKAEML